MATFKCKMCEGELELHEGESICTCRYCDSKQTVPRLTSNIIASLYSRANHYRRSGEYDKAYETYQKILDEDAKDAEAYWSLILCHYGIDYVEDPSSHLRVPTVNRTQLMPVVANPDYKSAIAYADEQQKVLYENEAKVIDEIQRKILTISEKEEPFDVFICYKESDESGRRTFDSVLAYDLYQQLILEGLKTFYAPVTLEDKLGQEYEPYIFAALHSAKVMVVLGTSAEHFVAPWVKNEWARYLKLMHEDDGRMLIPAYKDMNAYDLPEEFSTLQALDIAKIGFMQDLIRVIKRNVLGETKAKRNTRSSSVSLLGKYGNTNAIIKRGYMAIEDDEWEAAKKFFGMAIEQDVERTDAYLGNLMILTHVHHKEELKDSTIPFIYDVNYERLMRYANLDLRSEIEEYAKSSTYKIGKWSYHNGEFAEARDLFVSILGYKDAEWWAKEATDRLNMLMNTLHAVIQTNRSNRMIYELNTSKRAYENEVFLSQQKRDNLGTFAILKKVDIDTNIKKSKKAISDIDKRLSEEYKTIEKYKQYITMDMNEVVARLQKSASLRKAFRAAHADSYGWISDYLPKESV